MQRLEVSGAVRHIYASLGVKLLRNKKKLTHFIYGCLLILFNIPPNTMHIAHTNGWIYEQLSQAAKWFPAYTIYSKVQSAVPERSPSSEHVQVPFVWLERLGTEFTQLITRQKRHKLGSGLSWQLLFSARKCLTHSSSLIYCGRYYVAFIFEINYIV